MIADPFVSQLAEMCADEPTRAKWVFVPSHDVGLGLGDRLALHGHDWANLRFVTPLDIAVRMAAPFLLERGIDPSGDPLGPALVMRLMLDLPGEDGYFRPMVQHAGMAQALWRTVRELRYAGITAADLAASSFTGQVTKRDELVALLGAFECYLQTNAVADMPMVFEEARTHPEWCPIAPDDVVVELPDATWSPLVRRFLDSIPCRRAVPRVPALLEVPLPARSASLRPQVEPVSPETPTDASRLRFLQSPGAAGPPRGDGTLVVFHAGGRDAEIDEVCRRIFAEGWPLDQVEIACASEVYQALAGEKAARFRWNVTVSAGCPAAATRAGRLLLRYCDWIAGGFAASDLRRLLQSGDCRPGIEVVDEAAGDRAEDSPHRADDAGRASVSTATAARLLLKAKATSGRATYAAALARLAGQYDVVAGDAERSEDDRAWNARKAAQARALLQWIDRVLAAAPQPRGSANTVSLSDVVAGASAFLQANAPTASALDHVAKDRLVEALEELRVLGAYSCTLPDALVFLRERVASLVVGRERPKPGHLHVSSLARAGYSGRRYVFIVGLQEGGVFPPVVEDPVLLDAERRAIGPLLATSIDRQDEAVFGVLSRLAAIGLSAQRVCLSFSCFDSREFRETFPSWMVLQAFRLIQGKSAATYADLAAWLGEPASAVPATPALATSDAGWWLASAASARLTPSVGHELPASREPRPTLAVTHGRPDVRTPGRCCGADVATGTTFVRGAILRAYPALASGLHAAERRASDVFTEFDGHVAVAGAILDPTGRTRPISATTLESAAKCPLRFFIEQGLGVRIIDEERIDEDAWLDAARKGSELHGLFAAIMRELRAARRKPDLKRDKPRLLELGRKRLAELREELPPPSHEVEAREGQEFLDDLEAFIEAECAGRHGAHPVALELAFGFPLKDAEGEPLASAEPVVVELGDTRSILLHGRIDRVNCTAPGEYEVIDYKTGGYWPDDWKGTFAGGTRLQHALYGVAASVLLKRDHPKARVARGIYVFPAVKGRRRKKEIPAPSGAKVAEVLRDLTDVIASGAFVAADGANGCRWCKFKAACHAGEVTPVVSKRDNPANRALEPYRRLRGNHE